MTPECISVILPVFNEERNIAACLEGISRALQGIEHEILVCYDFDEDTTLLGIDRMERRPAELRLVRNTLGPGAAAAIRAGFAASRGDVVVTTMADLSDPPDVIPAMAVKIRRDGADVVSGSRYMKGGTQTGGPPLKRFLSRAAGLTLRWIAGMGTHDATTNFRAYRRSFLDRVRIESRSGMELALELTSKAHLGGFRVDEVPSTWRDRSAGQSRFRLWRWAPAYLRWYLAAMAAPLIAGTTLVAASVASLAFAIHYAPAAPFWADEWMYVPIVTGHRPFTPAWLLEFHNEHRIPLPKFLWFVIERLSGLDARWGVAVNVLVLTLAAAFLLHALRKLRGRTLWTDAFVPLLLLHWGHWENMTWPFQISLVLPVLFVSIALSILLSPRADPGRTRAVLFGLALTALPLCGASGLPFVAVLAPWWIWNSIREKRGRIPVWSVVGPALALIAAASYFVGRPETSRIPPSPGPGSSFSVALQCLAGGLGPEAAWHWPTSGGIALVALGLGLGILIPAARRPSPTRRCAQGLVLLLAATVGLTMLLGHARAGVSPVAGFSSRYAVLSFGLPFALYASAEWLASPAAGRLLRASLLALAAVLYLPSAMQASTILALRQDAAARLLQDARAGLPIRMVAAVHGFWCPEFPAVFEEGLAALAASRLSIYREALPPRSTALDADGARVTALRDGRIAVELVSTGRARIPLDSRARELRIDCGHYTNSEGDLRVCVRRFLPGRDVEMLWSDVLPRAPGRLRRMILRTEPSSAGVLEVTVCPVGAGATDAREPQFMMILETFP